MEQSTLSQASPHEYAKAFIAQRTEAMLSFGITSMTQRQRDRVKRLDVVAPDEREAALWTARTMAGLELPPRGSSGLMRVYDMPSGEIKICRVPKRPRLVEL